MTHQKALPRLLPRLGYLRLLLDMAAISRQRRRLGELDGDRLRDLGISGEEAEREARRPAWDVPHYWRR